MDGVATYALRNSTTRMEHLVADLSRVVETASPETRRATIVGESFGGALALSFALTHPEQVDALSVAQARYMGARVPGSTFACWRVRATSA